MLLCFLLRDLFKKNLLEHNKEMRDDIFFPIGIGFLTGTIGYYVHENFAPLGILFLALGCAILFCIRYIKQPRIDRIISCAIIGIVAAFLVAHIFEGMRSMPPPDDGAHINDTFVITSSDERSSGFVYTIKFSEKEIRQKFLLRSESVYRIGDIVEVSGTFQKPESFITDSGTVFDYKKYLWVSNTVGTIKSNDIKIVGEKKYLLPKRALMSIQESAINIFRNIFPYPESGLMGGFVLGEKHGLPDDVTSDMRVAGLSHIIVLSGFNIILVMTMTRRLVSPYLGYRSRRIIALLVALFLVLLSGAETPALRAFLMAGCAIISELTIRPGSAGRALMLTTAILTLLNPRALGYDVSFQLSILATIGVIYLAPRIEVALRRIHIPHQWKIRDTLAETIGAQIMVTPLLLSVMGTFSVYGILSNLMVTPLVPYLTMTGIALLFVGIISGGLGSLLAIPIALILSYIIWIAHKIATFPGALITIENLPITILLISYVLLGWWVMMKGENKQKE